MDVNLENLKDLFKREGDPSLSIDELGDNENFIDFGVDSLDRSSIFLAIEDDFGVRIPDDKIEELQTLNDLVEYIKANQ